MACNGYDNCVNQERENLKYPIDKESLYGNRLYDDHTASTRCYRKNPIEIMEGFGHKLTWNSVLKFIVIVLLVVLFVVFVKDFLMPKQKVNIGLAEPSEFRFSRVRL
jgi:hypothetical protein